MKWAFLLREVAHTYLALVDAAYENPWSIEPLNTRSDTPCFLHSTMIKGVLASSSLNTTTSASFVADPILTGTHTRTLFAGYLYSYMSRRKVSS